jgi:hypothetical protein
MRWVGTGLFVATVAAAVPLRAAATSYDPLTREEEPAAAEMAAGATIYLFHSGTEQVRRALQVGDVLEVTRVGADGTALGVGKIRVTASAGAVCLRGEVLEGRVRLHDVAEKGGVSCLVIPKAACGR